MPKRPAFLRISILILIVLITGFTPLKAQQVSFNQFGSWKPRCIGPSAMSGRITAIDVCIRDPQLIYLGAASGGVWKTENGGANWTPVFDDQPIQNIGSIAIEQDNPSVVWVGTGEGNPRNSANIGEGIYKSLDGGKTWTCMGLEKTRNIHRILIDPNNPNTVYAGAIGNPYGIHPDRGVYKTIDGGKTWEKILYTNDTSGVGDMVMDPSNPNKILAAMWQHHRTPWSFQSGGKGSGLFMTIDQGKTWKKLGKAEGLPEGDYGRIGIAISKSQPSTIYALVEASKNGLYRSDDGGYKWVLVNSEPRWVTNRPFYFQDIKVDPENENRLWLIYSMVAMSEDGGKSFNVIIPYGGIHPDHHAFWIHPNDGHFIIDGNDGGIGITHDRGKNWQFDEKIPVGQFYHVNVDNDTPYHVMGGLQDNGSWRGPGYKWVSGGIRNFDWELVCGGDGFDVMADPEHSEWIYAMSQEGDLERYNVTTGENWNIKPDAPNLQTRLRFNWNAAIAQDPFDPGTIYFGSQFLHRSANRGASWEIISPDLTTNDSVKTDQRNNGGLSIDITGAENYCSLITIAPSPVEKGVIWAGTDDGNIQLTRDGGKTWTNFRNKIPGMPVGCWVPQIRASRYHPGEAFVVCNDYRRGDFTPYIFRTTDFGKTWSRLLDEKKVKGYALCVLQDPVVPGLIFAGTEQGLWISLDNGKSFQQWKNGYPSVSTYDLAIQEREADLVIATFGRALFILDDIRPLRSLASGEKNPTKNLVLFQPPDAIQATYRRAQGYQWSTWGLWDAPNKTRGLPVSFFIRRDSKDTSTRLAARDSVWLYIYNENNERIRTLHWKADSGFNRFNWGTDQKGYRRPGSPKPEPGDAEPGGLQVLPGKYKLVLSGYNGRDSAFVNVLGDPRAGDMKEIKLAQRRMEQRLGTSADKLTAGMDRLSESEEVCNKIENQLKGLTGSEFDSLLKSTKIMRDSIKLIREFINGKQLEKQGTGQVPQVTAINQYNEARSAIFSKNIVPGPDTEKQVVEAEEMIQQALNRINQFYKGAWERYRQQAESTKINLFKNYTPL